MKHISNSVKSLLTALYSISALLSFSQHTNDCKHLHHCSSHYENKTATASELSNDQNIDIKFYHIDIEVAIDSAYLWSELTCMMEITNDDVTSILLDLDSALVIDNISSPASSYVFSDNIINIQLENTYNTGDLLSIDISYHGEPTLAGGYKGLRYETHNGNEPIIATLSTPYLAHYWYPCKDGPQDKADSVYIDITIPDVEYSDIPLIAVSNGLLIDTEESQGKRKFLWRHHYPIVPYYVMMAISNYEYFTQNYEGANGDEFPLDYYVFESHLTQAQTGVAQLPEVMDLFSELFGPYPFANEKYGMTQLGYYGGIENQTNTIINNMGLGWFSTSVHELAHMWFADMITCQEWNHGWLNEGFASYSEALWKEYTGGFSSYQNEMEDMEYYDDGTIYMSDVSNPYTVFQGIIYNKGAYAVHMLRGVLGDEDFFEALLQYSTSEDWMYGNAATEDLQTIFEEVSGMDLEYFFEQWIYDERYPNYHFNYEQDDLTGATALSIVQVQGPNNGWRNVFKMPMDVKFSFDNGTDTTMRIINEQQVQSYFYDFNETVINVQLDPEKWVLKNAIMDSSINVGVNESENTDENSALIVYPNPSKGQIFITADKLDLDENKHITISTMTGKELLSFPCQSFGEGNTIQLDIMDLDKGAYLTLIPLKDGEHIQVVVVQ